MTYRRINEGTCSRCTTVTLQGDIIQDVRIEEGCEGNLKGISMLCKGMKAQHVIDLLSGISCEDSDTSCPDQLARTLQEMLSMQK